MVRYGSVVDQNLWIKWQVSLITATLWTVGHVLLIGTD